MRETLVEGPDPLLGSRVAGRYTIMRRIAQGGMGVVYLAVQEGLGRAVALKIIRRESAADPVMQKRFEREARAVSSLGHPSIVTIHDFGRTDSGELFLAMEFVEGEVLRDVVRRKRRLSFAESLPVVECIVSALARAHAAGVVHRDLKPENVILPRQSASNAGAVAAKVLDFGLAKPHDPSQQNERLTGEGGFVGTPGYAAPEQTEGGAEHPTQDLYALGVVWFEMLVGEHPFAAPTPMKIVLRQMHEDPPELLTAHGGANDIPVEAAALVQRLLSRRAEARPQTAQEVLDVILRLKNATPIAHIEVVASVGGDSLPEAPTVPVRGGSPEVPANLTPGVPPTASPPAPASSSLPPTASGWRGVGLLFGGALVAGLAGAALVVTVNGGWPATSNEKQQQDAGPPPAVAEVVEVSEPARQLPVVELRQQLEVALEGIPTFAALQGVRSVLPESTLITWTRELSLLRIVDGEAAPAAERLQGLALKSELPLVLEVKELSPGRVLATAVRPEEASALPDAGSMVDGGDAPDAGALDVVTPGGLAP